VCDSALAKRFAAREMMFGMRDVFEYGECTGCGAVQLCELPTDMARYYPSDYYAFASERRTGLRMFVRRTRHRLTQGRTDVLARLAQRLKPHPAVAWIRRTGMRKDSRVLDVGSGDGHLLLDLHEAGFRHLTGVDAYVADTVEPAPGVRVVKGSIGDMQPSYDVLIFRHSLEHMPNQRETMAHAARLMAEDGWCVIAVPTISSYAWEHYGSDWVQLDAPRHIVLHSIESLRLLGKGAGLRLVAVEHDSTAFQLMGSELYRRDVPLTELGHAFSRAERRRYSRMARQLNAEGRGDQAVFYFRKAGA
jgi:2-polyprenyl-3-methyl-5-hydroxy-6-metoxy-1,4-benzoquinol methylase